MYITYYHVDAFTDKLFSGNPAGVCLLDKWITQKTMQGIAFENNLSETAFVVPQGGAFGIRWFTPKVEVELCGHATLATAHVIFHHTPFSGSVVDFRGLKGLLELRVEKQLERLVLDFPARLSKPCVPPIELASGLGMPPVSVEYARSYMAIYHSAEDIRVLKPDMAVLGRLDKPVIVTAPGEEVDFVSRFFAPTEGVWEDPVTGSSHCTLIPYWATRLGKTKLVARQISPRGGTLYCEFLGNRVKIGGEAVTYLTGQIQLP